jgi:hypothetical protein
MKELKLNLKDIADKVEISDGYHTFDELYDHRITLFIALCAIERLMTDTPVWKSKLHSDGTSFDGWFILGMFEEKGKQITYHLPMDRWDDCNFAMNRDKAPEWDGHTPEDVLNRLKAL